jgi:uncharacterized protein (TIGR02679 family)
MTPAARSWLAQPELSRLWDMMYERLQRNGLTIRGRVTLAHASYAEREALGLLMGRAYPSGTVTITLADLDQRLRSGAADCGLADVVTELRGPLTDRPAARSARQSARDQLWAAVDDAVRAVGLDGTSWAPGWLDEIRRGGVLARLTPDHALLLMGQAAAVLARSVPGRDAAERPAHYSRGELAERLTGTAHGLDDDTVLARIVLRGLARSLGLEFPHDARGRRELWEAVGIATDQVSSTVLTYGLAPLGDDWPARLLRERTQGNAEAHLTIRDLRRMTWRLLPGTEVFICENPRVVEAAADAGGQRPLVCTSGNPSVTVLTLLDSLIAAGARLAYRGDFDWPGVGMANRIIGRYQARPWRMNAADYEQHVSVARARRTPLQALSGPAVDAGWDPELAPAMRALGVAVQEESALELILADLA